MIIGIGSDLVDIQRIAALIDQYGDRFITRTFTSQEQLTSNNRANRAASYAKRFAAKEACAKALGTGFREGVGWLDISVSNNPQGLPILQLTGGAQAYLATLLPKNQIPRLHLSLTDDPPYAQAFVVIESVTENQVV